MINISQNFTVEITSLANPDAPEIIAQNLAASITSWEREFNEDEPEEEADDNGFLLPKDGDEEDEVDGEGSDEDGEEEEAAESDSTLYVTTTLNAEVLKDIKTLQASEDATIKISFIYGNETVGTIRREFEVDPDAFLSLGSGNKSPEDLVVGLTFDVYDSDTVL
jgi:hypothetical protein